MSIKIIEKFIAAVRNRVINNVNTSGVEHGLDGTESFRTDYKFLENKLGYQFKSKELLIRALTHRSAQQGRDRLDYERLEFLGDAVLDLTIAHLLSEAYPEAREGELSKMRAALVNTQALANVARDLELADFIRLGKGELSSGGSQRPSLLADVVEAILGAIYLDSSFEEAFGVISQHFDLSIKDISTFDPKTDLQEKLHANNFSTPKYILEKVEGPEHAPTFVTAVTVEDKIIGRGQGASKKSAQQLAAAQALERIYDKQSEKVTLLELEENISVEIAEDEE